MKKNVFQLIISLFKGSAFLVHLVISYALIFVAAYFFGYKILTDILSGNDALNNLTFIVYLNKYFPRIPLWFPYQGSGASITLGYPQLYSYVVIILHRISGLSLISSMGIVNFASLLLPAWGVYLFVSTRLKSSTGALIAGLLYLFSPMAYVWITGAGFLAQTFSLIFIAPYLICFDWFFESVISKKTNILALILTGISGALAFLGHPATMLGLFAYTALYGVGRVLLGAKKEPLVKRLIRGIGGLGVTAAVVMGLMAFWYLPLSAYMNFAFRDVAATLDRSIFPWMEFKGVLGLYGPNSGYPFGDFSILPGIWILALLAIPLGWFYDRRVCLIGLFAFLAIFFAGSLTTWYAIAHVSFFFAQFFTIRTWFPLAVFLNPIAAAMTLVFIGKTVVLPLTMLLKQKLHPVLNLSLSLVTGMIQTVIVFIIFGLILLPMIKVSPWYDDKKPHILPVGSSLTGTNWQGIWNRSYLERCKLPPDDPHWSKLCARSEYTKYFEMNTLIPICDMPQSAKSLICTGEKQKLVDGVMSTVQLSEAEIKAEIGENCQAKPFWGVEFYPDFSPCLALGKTLPEQLKRWPIPDLVWGGDVFTEYADTYDVPDDKKEILLDENHRIDVTPHFGTAVKTWKIGHDSSILNSYTGQIMLNKTFYSVFNDNFYDNPKTDPQVLNNLAKYYGTEAVVVNASKSPMQSFAQAGWERYGGESAVVFPPFPNGLVAIGQLPKVLVIGDAKKQVFKQVFTAAISGALPFEKGILVNGGEVIGQHKLADLQKYELVILQGYKYKSRFGDLQLLKDYIEGGGSVFIDTGWQYVSPDCGTKDQQNNQISLPDPFPVAYTFWGEVGKDFNSGQLESASDIDLRKFSPWEWEDKIWSVAYTDKVKAWAKPILDKDGKVVVAGGPLGKGRVIWSGINILAHAVDKKNPEEIKFIGWLFTQLLGTSSTREVRNFSLSRPQPEKMIIKLNENTDEDTQLYFREAYYPSWRAQVNGQNLFIRLAGPSFMLVDLPKLSSGSEIIFEFRPPRSIYIGGLITLGTAVVLLILFFASLGRRRLFVFLGNSIDNLTEKFKFGVGEGIKQIKKSEDEDY